ncbi:MAG: type II secretion system protein [Gammaproteobacteria bacterium]|nr:type II secretion system protein [Gammaproteobacteria bacterium]
MNKSQAGFTLVELVVVILILGILSATALPRFMNINDQAHQAAVAGAGGGFGAGAALVRAQWIANQEAPGDDDVVNFGAGNVAVTTSNAGATQTGWPTGTGTADSIVAGTHTQCVNLWTGIMQNPPTVQVTGGGANVDYDATATANVCTYAYNNDAANARSISFTTVDGTVTIINP